MLELAPNLSLFNYIHPTRGIPERLALRLLYQTAEALKYLHDQDILHRDIKPENLLFDENFNVKICDFGWSCKVENENDPRMSICGTYEYMSPEILSREPHGKKTDIWCLGILMYEMIYGSPPFRAKSVTIMKLLNSREQINLNTRISPATKDLMENMLRKEPELRFDIDQVLNHHALQEHLADFGSSPFQQDLDLIRTYYSTGIAFSGSHLISEINQILKRFDLEKKNQPLQPIVTHKKDEPVIEDPNDPLYRNLKIRRIIKSDNSNNNPSNETTNTNSQSNQNNHNGSIGKVQEFHKPPVLRLQSSFWQP